METGLKGVVPCSYFKGFTKKKTDALFNLFNFKFTGFFNFPTFNPPQKCLRLYEIQRKIPVSRARLKSLISGGKSNNAKIRI